MNNNFDKILDECIDRINHGQSLEDCLADYSEYAEQLKPLLQAMLETKGVYSFVPSASAKRTAREQFNTVLNELEQKRWEGQSLFSRLFARPLAWATVAVVVLLAVGGIIGFNYMTSPTGPSPIPDPEGNFVFLISDDVNAIDDFESLTVYISNIGLVPSGDSEQSVEFKPEVGEVDLTAVKGDKTQQIWKGNVPEDQYSKVFIHVTDVRGVLKETGQVVEVKLPSQKLHISKPFQVTADTVTSFTYDLTVVAAGSPQSGIKYTLKPQVAESGAKQKTKDDKAKGQSVSLVIDERLWSQG
jgi:hypothetical protein